MGSEFIRIDPAKSTLTIFVGKDPVVVVRTDEFDRAFKYAKLLRRRVLADLIHYIKVQLADESAGLDTGEKRKLSKTLKGFEKERASRRSK